MKEFTVKELAELLDVSKPTVQRAINKLSINASTVIKNKFRYYKFEDIRAVIEAIRPDFDFSIIETPQDGNETPLQGVETPQKHTETLLQDTETLLQDTETLEQNTATPKNDNSSELETINRMLEILQKELEKKDIELAKKDEKIEKLESKLHDAYLQISDFGQKAQYITAVDKTNQYLENKNGEENIVKSDENEPKKKGFFSKLFGK